MRFYQGITNLPPLWIPLLSTLAPQCALMAQACRLAACLWPTASLDTLPSRQEDTAFAATKLNSLWKSCKMMLSHS